MAVVPDESGVNIFYSKWSKGKTDIEAVLLDINLLFTLAQIYKVDDDRNSD
jgi:hypothetical protein